MQGRVEENVPQVF